MSDNSETLVAAVLGMFGVVIAAVLAFIAGRTPALAQQQRALNDSFEQYRIMTDARITELEGELRGERQYTQSLVEFLRRQGLDVPHRPPPAEVVFMVPPTAIKGAVNG